MDAKTLIFLGNGIVIPVGVTLTVATKEKDLTPLPVKMAKAALPASLICDLIREGETNVPFSTSSY